MVEAFVVIGLSRGLSVFAFTEAVDMRKSFNTLSALMAEQMKREVRIPDGSQAKQPLIAADRDLRALSGNHGSRSNRPGW